MGYKTRRLEQVDINKPYLTVLEAASVLQRSPEQLRKDNKKGFGPFPVDLPGRPIYRTADVLGLGTKHPREIEVS